MGAQESTIQQYGIAANFVAGNFDGEFLCTDMSAGQEIGIGSFDKLDGEMIMLDGFVYRLPADGKARVAEPGAKSAFSTFSKFTSPMKFKIAEEKGYDDLKAAIDEKIPAEHMPAILLMRGTFKSVEFRSIAEQTYPYPTLAEAAQNQVKWTLENVKGAVVGFRFPEKFSGVNLAGWHFHFIDEEKKTGGHVLTMTSADLSVQVQYAPNVNIKLPKDPEGKAIHAPKEEKKEEEPKEEKKEEEPKEEKKDDE